jgi:nucleotide-binding universal stress UspA family protein
MFKRIAVAYNESPEARCALASAIQLARTLGAELRTVTIVQGLPANMCSFAALDKVVTSDRLEAYDKLHPRLARPHCAKESNSCRIFSKEMKSIRSFVSSLNTRSIYS